MADETAIEMRVQQTQGMADFGGLAPPSGQDRKDRQIGQLPVGQYREQAAIGKCPRIVLADAGGCAPAGQAQGVERGGL